MEPNQNPPSERAWSIAEQEEFFASQDAITGAIISNAPFRENWFLYPAGIHVTYITPPAQGWPIAMHCPICRDTTFILSPWAIKPINGDYFKMKDTCSADGICDQHNMRMAVNGMNPHIYERILCGPYDAVIEQEMSIEEAKRRFPNTPVPGEK
jgi:hypothetical protein